MENNCNIPVNKKSTLKKEGKSKQKKKLTNEEIKQATMDLYAQLPQDKDVPSGNAEEARKACIDIRDKIIELNYTFFGFVAKRTVVYNSAISFEDKFQSALSQFLQCWWRYQWEGHYRCDISFGVFFTLRLSEMVHRELTQVKMSVDKSLKEEVAQIVNKPRSQVKYEDLSNPEVQKRVPASHIESLKAIFGIMYSEDLDTYSMFLTTDDEDKETSSIETVCANLNYDSVEDLLIREMIEREDNLNNKKTLKELSEMYGIDIYEIKKALPNAEKRLYNLIQSEMAVQHYNKPLLQNNSHNFHILRYEEWPEQFKPKHFDYFTDNQEEVGHIKNLYRGFQIEYKDSKGNVFWTPIVFLSKSLIYKDNELYAEINKLYKNNFTLTNNLIFKGYYQQRQGPLLSETELKEVITTKPKQIPSFLTYYRIDYNMYYNLLDKYEGTIESEFTK